MKIYDASNQILGRMSTIIAKELLKGEKVVVVNCEKSVISGSPKYKSAFYLNRVHRGDVKHGPFFPKTPDDIFRRTVRGMVPWHQVKGRNAFKNLRVFIGLPEQFKNKTLEKVEKADADKLKSRYITLGNLSISIGAKKRW